MEDKTIVDLYWARNERAIGETQNKYGKMLHSISYSLLSSREDAEECVNDTYLDAWNAMPSERPDYLGAFLSKITRRISVDRYRAIHRLKRGGADGPEAIFDELAECVPSGSLVEEEYENGRLADALNGFLASQEPVKRIMFLRRYFYSQPIGEIAKGLRVSESSVKVTLYRMRESLRKTLTEQELL